MYGYYIKVTNEGGYTITNVDGLHEGLPYAILMVLLSVSDCGAFP
jgi:hypothetical protein